MVERILADGESEAVELSNYKPIYALLSLLLIVGCLIAYKATASLAVIEKVQATGALKPRFDLILTFKQSEYCYVRERTDRP